MEGLSGFIALGAQTTVYISVVSKALICVPQTRKSTSFPGAPPTSLSRPLAVVKCFLQYSPFFLF